MSWRRHLLLFVVLVPVFNLLTVLALPSLINRVVLHRIVSRAMAPESPPTDAAAVTHLAQVRAQGGINIAIPAPRADARARTVVRPSPDLLYTACVFDLRDGPLHLGAPVPDSYLSIAGFGMDTNNFFAVNDQSAQTAADGQRRIDLLLSRQPIADAPAGMRVIVAPEDRGLVLFRLLIPSDQALPRLREQFQKAQRCEPLSAR